MTISHNLLAKLPANVVATVAIVVAGTLLCNAGRGEYGFGERTPPTKATQTAQKSAPARRTPPQQSPSVARNKEPRNNAIRNNASASGNNDSLVDNILYGEGSMLVEDRNSQAEETTTPAATKPEKELSEYQHLRKIIAGDRSRNLKQLEALLESGVSANATKDDGSGHTILHYAVWDDQRPEVVEMLLRYGADPNATRKDGVPVLRLCFAKDRDNAQLAELLCDYGADVNCETKDGTLLSAALKFNKPKVGKVLRNYGGRISKTHPNADLPVWGLILRSPPTKSPSAGKNNAKGIDNDNNSSIYALKGMIFDLKRAPNGVTLAPKDGAGSNRRRRLEQLHTALRITAGGDDAQNNKHYNMHHFTTTVYGRWSLNELKKRWVAAPTTLYTTSIFIVDKKTGNSTNSARAPEAFADEDGKIPFEASGWLCYYEGWFGVPETGMYRFVGMADDAMAVGVDKKTVLYAFYPREGHGPAVNFVTGWEPNNCCGVGGNDGLELSLSGVGQRKTLYKGSWLRLDANRRYRIQVIFGEAYGGLASATLGIQKYGEDNDNNFPLFTLEKMEPDPDLKIDETGMYNTSAVFRALK